MFVSLVTHGLQAVVISLLSHRLWQRRQLLSSSVAVTAGALIMVLGYTLGRAFVYSTPEYAVLKLPFEFLQAGFGAAASMLLLYPMQLKELFRQYFHVHPDTPPRNAAPRR